MQCNAMCNINITQSTGHSIALCNITQSWKSVTKNETDWPREKSNNSKLCSRKWKVGLRLPALSSTGVYKLYGTIPPNLELGTSTGDIRLNAKQVDLTVEMDLGVRDGDKLEAKTFDLNLDLDDINVEMECLFPKNDRCCPRKFLKSCNAILAKTVLRLSLQ